MRAPLCPDSSDVCHEDQHLIGSENSCKAEIQALEKSLERRRSDKSAVFGICLESLMGTSSHVAPRVPFVLSRLCRYIEAHGLHHKHLFSESEHRSVEMLRVEFVESGDAPLEAAGDVPAAAKLLIMFLEELPEPLIPIANQSAFVNDMDKFRLDSSECIGHLKQNVTLLPDATLLVLKYLLRFLLRVLDHQEYNGMNAHSLSLIFGPLLFRPSPEDTSVLLVVKNIAKCFMQDYHAIFGEDLSSLGSNENIEKQLKNSTERTDVVLRRQIPCPGAPVPLSSLTPLSIVIPTVESSFQGNKDGDDSNGNIPVLLIESQMEGMTKNETFEEQRTSEPFTVHKESIVPTRKRKERRPSGEEVQVQQRSSSEERPSSGLMDKTESLRRCSSHEEVMDAAKSEDGVAKNIMEKEGANVYFPPSSEQCTQDKDKSPHPPNAKRREMESSDMQNEPCRDDYGVPWRTMCSSFDDPSGAHERSLNLDLVPRYDSKQNSLTEMEETLMECSASRDIPRTLACSTSYPLPETEPDSPSLSWSLLFEYEDAESALSGCEMSRASSKEGREESALLSPSVQSLRRSSLYEAPLSPSAYRSYLSYRSTHLDPSVPPSPPVEQEDFAKSLSEGNAMSDTVKQLTKKIHGLKKKIRRFEENFEKEFGYKPSHAEKASQSETRKAMSELHKARKELKVLKDETHLDHASRAAGWRPIGGAHILGDATNSVRNDSSHKEKMPSMEESFGDTIKTLAEERRNAKRPDSVEEMTKEQVRDEKVALQKALLHFESIHGKPMTKGDRSTTRPLYDRYRCVKRLLIRSGSFPGAASKNKDASCGELQPILEHETMDFTSPQHRTSGIEGAESSIPHVEEDAGRSEPIEENPKPVTTSSQFLTSKYDNSNIHELPLSEMIFHLQQAKSEKRHLRKILREFEMEFQRLNGRKVQKEDKAPIETLYGEYKHVKARLKLLEALISKHDQHQLM